MSTDKQHNKHTNAVNISINRYYKANDIDYVFWEPFRHYVMCM